MSSTSSAERIVFPSGGEIHVVATVQGLVAEREHIRLVFAKVDPTVIALGVSAESAATLLKYAPAEGFDPFEELPDHDYIYSLKLREFGAIELPPPDLHEAARLAAEASLPVVGIDLSEQAYESTFTKEVGVFDFLRYGRVQRKLAKRSPKAADAAGFALAWDARLRKIKGIARVEAAREEHIATQAATLASEPAARVLLTLDIARAEGVLTRLRAKALA